MRQFGKSVAIGVVFNGDPGAIYVVQLTYPFVTGGTYQISLTVDGAGYDTIAAGTYTVLGKDEHAPPGGGPRLTSLRH
jgi:hypothetical protein